MDDETSRPVDARDVVSFLLEREHLAAAFELFQDVVESTSASHGAPAEHADDVGRLEEARDALERYFGDRERFPPRDLRAYAEQVDVPLLQASVREQESRARVAEYDAELAAEDLERARVQLEASELERRAAEKRASLGAANEKKAASFVTPPRAFVDPETSSPSAADEKREQNANDASVSRHLPPLAAPNATERNALNALVADYLDRRGYRATLLTLRDEADSFSRIMKDSADERFSVPADGLRRAVHRASRLDARDAAHDALSERASAASIRAETLERALAAKEAEAASLAGRVAATEARASETRGEADALARRLEDAARSIAGLETERANATRDFERAAATAKHLEADLEGKTREFKKALAEERRARAESTDAETTDSITPPTTPVTLAHTNETNETTDSITPPITPPSHVFEASAEEEATIRALADALPRVASATLVAERRELLPLFARAATRHKVAASRREMLRSLFDLVKRPERAHRDALAATAFAIARDAGEDRAVRELVPALRLELAHRKQERRLAACACVGSVAKLSDVDLSERARWTVLFPALRDAFVNASDTFSTEYVASDTSSDASTSGSRLPCPETRDAVLSAFAAVCDGSSAEDAAFAADAAPFLAAALADASERVSERACETAAPAMTRWCVRSGGGGAVSHLESFAKGHAAARAAEALGTRVPQDTSPYGDASDAAHKKSLQEKSSPPPPPRDADRWRARFYLRLFARTLETFREEAGNVKGSKNAFDSEVTRWFDANASELVRLVVHAIPVEDDDATLLRDAARAVRALCAAAGAGVARERVVPALTREDLEDRYLATATPIAFAAALPHCGPGALEAFTREYVARECLKTQTLERSDGARDDDGGISSGLFLESSSLAERAIRRAVSLCDDGDDAAGTVRDAITRVLAAVASFRGASAEEDEKTADADARKSDATGPASLATTLLGAAAAACPAASAKHMRVFSEHVFPALSRNAAGPACVAARAAAALVCIGDAHADDAEDTDGLGQETGSPFEAGVSAEALRLLDVCLLRRDARIAAAFAAAARAAAEARRRPGATASFFARAVVTGRNETKRNFWDGVASRVAAIATSAFGADDAFALQKKDVATRARLASLCFGAARSLLETEDDVENARDGVDVANSKRRDVLVPALRALASANRDAGDASRGTETSLKNVFQRSLLDASDVALAEAMLRDEDWRLVASAEAAARAVTAVTAVTAERRAAERERERATRVRKKSYAPSMPAATAAMRRAMGVSSRLSVVAAAEDTRGGDLGESPASPAEVDFATLVGEAAPRHDAGDAASDGRGDTRDARDEGSPAAETAGTNTRTRAATKEKEDFDAPPTPTSSKTEDAPERKPGTSTTATRLPSQANKEKMSSKMFSAMPSAPKMPSLLSVKNPFGK